MIQPELAIIFSEIRKRTPLTIHTELHLRVAEGRVRIADFAAYETLPDDEVPTIPPLVVIEIVSPSESLNSIVEKCRDYMAWGVPNVFVVNPRDRAMYRAEGGSLISVESLSIPELEATIEKAQVFGA